MAGWSGWICNFTVAALDDSRVDGQLSQELGLIVAITVAVDRDAMQLVAVGPLTIGDWVSVGV